MLGGGGGAKPSRVGTCLPLEGLQPPPPQKKPPYAYVFEFTSNLQY